MDHAIIERIKTFNVTVKELDDIIACSYDIITFDQMLKGMRSTEAKAAVLMLLRYEDFKIRLNRFQTFWCRRRLIRQLKERIESDGYDRINMLPTPCIETIFWNVTSLPPEFRQVIYFVLLRRLLDESFSNVLKAGGDVCLQSVEEKAEEEDLFDG